MRLTIPECLSYLQSLPGAVGWGSLHFTCKRACVRASSDKSVFPSNCGVCVCLMPCTDCGRQERAHTDGTHFGRLDDATCLTIHRGRHLGAYSDPNSITNIC